MDIEAFRALCAKITNGSASEEEKLLFLKEMNSAMEAVHEELSTQTSTP